MKDLPEQPVVHPTIPMQLTNSMCYATPCDRLISLDSNVGGLVAGRINDTEGPSRK